MPSSEINRTYSPPRRVSLFQQQHHGFKKIALSRLTVVAWSCVALWGSLLLAFETLHQEYRGVESERLAAVKGGVLEGVRPPVSIAGIVWDDLYPTERIIPQQSIHAKPRTFPDDYESMPRSLGPRVKARPRASKLEQLRHLSSNNNKRCQPKSKWHQYSFPTCNSMHELDFVSGVVPPADFSSQDIQNKAADSSGEVFIEYMFQGASRSAWLVHSACTDGSDCAAPGLNATESKASGPKLVLKTLNWPMVYDEVVLHHQRIDALASERLTSSPHVIDIYSFCGAAVINEFADGGSFGRMLRHNPESMSPEQRLEFAKDAALGLADIHEVDGRGNVSTLIHHDFAGKNFLTVNGKLKISDFNDGQLLRWDKKADRRCHGFFWDGKCGSNRERTNRRAPEECMGDRFRYATTEKVEVYHLGSFLFALLTNGGWPYKFEVDSKGVTNNPTSPQVKKMIVKGILPSLPVEVQQSNNTATKVLAQAMKWAYTRSPKKRPSARAVGEFLDRKLRAIRSKS